jgi:hypothetical protein
MACCLLLPVACGLLPAVACCLLLLALSLPRALDQSAYFLQIGVFSPNQVFLSRILISIAPISLTTNHDMTTSRYPTVFEIQKALIFMIISAQQSAQMMQN